MNFFKGKLLGRLFSSLPLSDITLPTHREPINIQYEPVPKQTEKTSLDFFLRPSKISELEKKGVSKGERRNKPKVKYDFIDDAGKSERFFNENGEPKYTKGIPASRTYTIDGKKIKLIAPKGLPADYPIMLDISDENFKSLSKTKKSKLLRLVYEDLNDGQRLIITGNDGTVDASIVGFLKELSINGDDSYIKPKTERDGFSVKDGIIGVINKGTRTPESQNFTLLSIGDSPEADLMKRYAAQLPEPLFLFGKVDGDVNTQYVAQFRNYLERNGVHTYRLSNLELLKILEDLYVTLSALQRGLVKGSIFWHTSPNSFDSFDLSLHQKGNPGIYFSTDGGRGYMQSLTSDYRAANSLPYLLTDIERILLAGEHNQDIRLPYGSNILGEDIELAGVPHTSDPNIGLEAKIPFHQVFLNRETGIKSLYPHPSLFRANEDGTVSITRDWESSKLNYKQGGTMNYLDYTDTPKIDYLQNGGEFGQALQNAVMGAAVAENPSVMIANGWESDSNTGEWTQDPNRPGLKKLRRNLKIIGDVGANIYGGNLLTMGAKAANLKYLDPLSKNRIRIKMPLKWTRLGNKIIDGIERLDDAIDIISLPFLAVDDEINQ